eukprot:UC1_evm1s817
MSVILCLEDLLSPARAARLRTLSLKLLSVLAFGVENVSQNPLVEHLMLPDQDVFEALCELFRTPDDARLFGEQAVLLLAVLSHYRSSEIANPYARGLRALADDVLLGGMAGTMMRLLSVANARWAAEVGVTPGPASGAGSGSSSSGSGNGVAGSGASSSGGGSRGLFGALSGMISSLFVGADAAGSLSTSARVCGGVLVFLFQVVYLNPGFLAVLAHTEVDVDAAAGGA